MNAPTPTFQPATYGTPEAERECIAEAMHLVSIYAALAQQLAEVGDDVGLEYMHRKLRAYVNASTAALTDLRRRP